MMLKKNLQSRQFPSRTPHMLALFYIAALICGLLITNYVTQRSLQQANIQRLQQNLEERGKSISYFFRERENEIQDLAAAKSVSGFFSNRSLGMTMAYGLRASLNNVNRLFNRHMTSSRLGESPIYTHLFLLDKNGDMLARWPAIDMAEFQPVPEEIDSGDIIIKSHGAGVVSFTAPVMFHDTLQGYLRGWVNYNTLIDYLLGSTPGLLFITDHDRLVFQTEQNITVLNTVLKELSRTETTWPLQIPHEDLIEPLTSDHDHAEESSLILFFTNIPGYQIDLYLAEQSSSVTQQQSFMSIMPVLAVLSIGVFMVAVMILRAGTKNLILETSLVEAGRREEAIAEKVEELKLIIDGARLGTWNWNISSGEVIFNKRWLAMIGYGPGEINPHVDSWKELVHPDDWEMVTSNLQAHLKGETSVYSVEHRLRHKSGEWVWVLDAGKVLRRDQDGNPLQAMGIHLDLSKQKETQQLLGKAKEEADAIIRNFLDTLIVVNRELNVIRVNQATCQLLGYGEDELLGRPVTMFFHDSEELVQETFSFYAAAGTDPMSNSEELRNVELCYRTKDGTQLPMSFNIQLLHDERGQVVGVVAGAKDISALKTAMEKVSRQMAYIENIFDVVPEGLLAIASSMAIVKSNMAYGDIIQTWASRFDLTEEKLTCELLARLKETLPDHEDFTFSLSHNNMTAIFRYNATPVPALRDIEHVVSIRDITDERKAEAARKLLATVIEQTADTVIITDPVGVIHYVNPSAVQISGYSRAELLGKKTSLFKSQQTDPATFQKLWQTITKGNVWSGRLTSLKKDSTPIEEDVTISPVRNEKGDITNFVAIKRDVTQMDLLQRQLLQAQKMEAIGHLAAGIAHEINTPMQYVQNNVTFFERAFNDIAVLLGDYKQLQESPEMELNTEARKHLDAIDLGFLMEEIPESISETHDGINRVVKIVSAMKDFSHPGTDEKTATDINQALKSTITVSRNEWKYLAEMDTDFDLNLPMVPCYPDQLNQAVLNLIINAAHAIEETGASVPNNPGHISISSSHDAEWVEIRISDTGGGVPEGIRERIFDPFFTTKEVGKGTGQGLSIIHDVVVQKHGGNIDFISAPDQGTTFILRLPIRTTENAEAEV